MYRPQEVIAKKRDGGELSGDEIMSFIRGVCTDKWADYQISALVMAMFIRGLSDEERDAMTNAMVETGESFQLGDIDLPKADKHSTGGVGDKTSLVIAPLAAACGLAVPMVSGRGLGHTGGTLDKLEAIAGYNVRMSRDEMKEVIKKCGFVMAGQTDEIAPADRKLYALRDATATVPYIPLIVASIMSKKMSEDLDALVLDVKTGSGAFMPVFEDSIRLAAALVATGKRFGVKTQAVVSDMAQPLGRFVGNALETFECLKILQGEAVAGSGATLELSLELTGRMIELAGVSSSAAEARKLAEERLADGSALEKFKENILLQGGDADVCERPEKLLTDDICKVEIRSAAEGFVSEIDTNAIGNAVVKLGGGRTRAEDTVDHAVGFECMAKIGDKIAIGEPLGIVYSRTAEHASEVSAILSNAYRMSAEPSAGEPLIKAII